MLISCRLQILEDCDEALRPQDFYSEDSSLEEQLHLKGVPQHPSDLLSAK